MLFIHNPMATCAVGQTGIVKGIIASNRSTLMYWCMAARQLVLLQPDRCRGDVAIKSAD